MKKYDVVRSYQALGSLEEIQDLQCGLLEGYLHLGESDLLAMGPEGWEQGFLWTYVSDHLLYNAVLVAVSIRAMGEPSGSRMAWWKMEVEPFLEWNYLQLIAGEKDRYHRLVGALLSGDQDLWDRLWADPITVLSSLDSQ